MVTFKRGRAKINRFSCSCC